MANKPEDSNNRDGFSRSHDLAGSIPKLEIVTNPQGDYGLNGWAEVDRWGYLNHPAWNYVKKHADAQGWDEVTKLKVLADTLLRHHVELQCRVTEMLKHQPIPPVVLSSNSREDS